MKKRWWVVGGIALLAAVGPFAVPVNSTGTLSNTQLSDSLVQTGEYRSHIEVTSGSQDRYFVLLHGFGASSFSWRDVAQPLSAYGTVIAYDRPGFGLTDRPSSWGDTNPYSSDGALEQLEAVLDLLVPTEAELYLMGHSAGAPIAAQYALDNPGRVSGLVLVAPAILTTGGAPSWLNWLFSVPQLDHLGPLLVSSIASDGLEIIERSYSNPELITDELLAGYQQPLQIAGWERAFWEFNRAERSFDVAQRLREITIPVLVITGDDDRIVATADSIRVATLLPNAVLVTVVPSGHLPHEELPQEFIRQFSNNFAHLAG